MLRSILSEFTFVTLLLLLSISCQLHAQENIPKPVISNVSDNIYRIYLGGYVNVFLYKGAEENLLIDTGLTITADDLKKTLGELGAEEIKYVVNTHADGDHVGGNYLFGGKSVIIADKKCAAELSATDNFPEKGVPDISISETVTLFIEDEIVSIIPLPNAHTNGDVVLHFQNQGIVFAGDILVGDTFPVLWLERGKEVSNQALLANLVSLMSMFPDDTRYILSHGREYTREELSDYHKMVKDTYQIVLNSYKDNLTVEEMIDKKILEDFSQFNSRDFDWLNTEFRIRNIYEDIIRK